MKLTGINIFSKKGATRINSSKKPPKIITHIPFKPVDTSVPKTVIFMNKVHKNTTGFFKYLKNFFMS